MTYETIIGLETHIQLATKTKLFSPVENKFGAKPNVNINEIDLGLPGVLPVLNAKAVFMAIKFGLSINATITKEAVFARKNYFYPDLPKGYQITQHESPIITNGYLNIDVQNIGTGICHPNNIDVGKKRINIIRAHLEEDSGKLLHENLAEFSGVDFNRAGIVLLEIVTAPDLRSSKEAVLYLRTLHNLVRYLEISDANLEEGNFRTDVNVSLRKIGQEKFGTRCEIKNLNSFRFVERAIEAEIKRQTKLLENDEKISQQTLLYDEKNNLTYPMRSKEAIADYRYFSDPDLLPLSVDKEYIASIRQTMPELPWQKKARFMHEYNLSEYDANILCADLAMADYFEGVCKLTSATAKLVANWLISVVETRFIASQIKPEKLAKLLDRIADATISLKIAKEIFIELQNNKNDIDEIIAVKNLQQISDVNELKAIIKKVITAHPKEVARLCAGKKELLGFFIGQVMKATNNKANPKVLNELLQLELHFVCDIEKPEDLPLQEREEL